MKNIYSITDFSPSKSASFDKQDWTVVIPMAGKGTRLNFDKPKALYPILGKSILSWLLSNFDNNCCEIILVVSPLGELPIQHELKKIRTQKKTSIVIQENPKGMADAVLCAKSLVKTSKVVVVWGDQVTLSSHTLAVCQHLLEKENAALALPTFHKKLPYISLDRDEKNRVIRVRQKREGEITEEYGENDCGVFCFEAKKLFQVLESKKSLGSSTKEYNLVPLLPFFEDNNGIVTLQLDSEEETLGINTVEDAIRAELILSKRG